MGKWFGEALVAFLLAVFDRWLNAVRENEKKKKQAVNDREHEEALNKAQKEYDTTDLAKEIGEKL